MKVLALLLLAIATTAYAKSCASRCNERNPPRTQVNFSHHVQRSIRYHWFSPSVSTRLRIHKDCLADGRDGRPKEGRDVPAGYSRVCSGNVRQAIKQGCLAACTDANVSCDGLKPHHSFKGACINSFRRFQSKNLFKRCENTYRHVPVVIPQRTFLD